MALDLSKLIEKHSLVNAFSHEGKAQAGAIIGKLIAEDSKYKEQMKELAPKINKIVADVNKLTIKQQEEKLLKVFPEFFEKKEVEEKKAMPELPKTIRGKVVTRIAPEPSGFMHIGHAMSFYLNYAYAKQFGGKCILRFEDTNPKKCKAEYYESFKKGLKWLGVKWDKEKNLSDAKDMAEFYKYGEKLLKENKAYACECSAEEIKRDRAAGKACHCREHSVETNLKLWKEMLAGKKCEGEIAVRFKGNLQSKDYNLRDLNIFRIVEHPHPLVGTKYKVWPTYDFANVVEDYICGITHVFRSNEFRVSAQDHIVKLLGIPRPVIRQYPRFNVIGLPFAKRKLRPLLEQGFVKSWDDPRFPTIASSIKRGFTPEAITNFTLAVGPSQSQHEFDLSMFYAENRKILEPISKRFYFVAEPVLLKVKNAPEREIELKYHPDKDLGSRKIKINDKFYIAKSDAVNLKKGQIVRLLGPYNIRIEKVGKEILASYHSDELIDNLKLQWSPADKNVSVEILVPDVLYKGDKINPDSLKIVKGLAEPAAAELKEGDIIQFVRFGFCRLDKRELNKVQLRPAKQKVSLGKEKGKLIFCYAHN